MESAEIILDDRARKRLKREVHEESVNRTEGLESKGRETRLKALVGRYVRKEFFLGKVVSYSSGLYRVDYEDGDCEDLECGEIREILLGEGHFDADLNTRKTKLDELISLGGSKTLSRRLGRKAVASSNDLDGVEALPISKSSSDFEYGSSKGLEPNGVQKPFRGGDADSSSDSCEFVCIRDSRLETTVPHIPPPSLPPSSGNIGIPEESVSHLFSVYSFLRSFSIQLFLSPFGLDDFVGSLNCVAPNTLLDAIHFALMRALRRHLEMLSSDGAELASKCLRHLDWSLLDTLTWPVYVVEYLLIMGYTKGLDWKGFYTGVLDKEYYSLSVTRKLMILQILCDDIIESAELRAEIDMRESAEVGTDSDGTASLPPENGPRRVHPRYSKTSACKNPEAMGIIAESHELKSPHCRSSSGSKLSEPDTDAADVDQDGNGDECRLCGMDGTLLCCDGCPSAYHTRCIGLSKLLIPEGSWFCPECTVTKMGPTLRIGTGLRGAEIFGIDPYEQVFLGTCNHLLVLKTAINAGPSSRYYNLNDIAQVLRVLCSSVQYTTLYSGICKGISLYWEIAEDTNFALPVRIETGINLADDKEGTMVSIPSNTLSGKETHKLLDAIEGENYGSCVTESNVENRALSCQDNDCQEAGLNSSSLDTVSQADPPGLQKDDFTAQLVCPLTNNKSHEQFGTDSTVSTESVSLNADPSDLIHQSLAERSIMLELASCASGNKCGANREDSDGMFLPASNGALSMYSESRKGKHSADGNSKEDMNDDCSYMGAFFKPQSYINQYILGDVAATAAANLAVLSSEEYRVSEARTSSNPRKIVSANISLQVKAFSSASIRFIWPNSEKKLVEVPRERCGWCLSCKAPATSKKGCLLNLAAANAIRGSSRILGGLRPIKNGDGYLPGIAAYILYMEERLRGLIVGPFLIANYRKQWRKQVEQASTCNAIKLLLLELEENIRLVAFSAAWVKLVDDRSVEASVAQISTCSTGTQKRGPGGRRNRKQSLTLEITTDPCDDNLKSVSWRRGGKLSKLIFHKGILPCSIVKKAARQGGSRKISGVYYAEGSEIPKRSRRFAWRAAVEMSRNAPQLALQVRYLDLHVRWSDLVCPELNSQDGKGTETEISAFRDAVICDKKIQENKIEYGLFFGNQNHLPSRVMKNSIEVEQNQDGKDKFWLSESHIPLYLIKEYEEKAEKVPLPSAKMASHILSKLQRRQLRACRRDIFSYIMRKGEKLDKCSCASCQEDVLLRAAVKCSACQGYCHKDCCTIPFTVDTNGGVEFLITCNQCLRAKAVALNENSKEPPICQLSLQGKEHQMAATVTRGAWQNSYHQPFVSTGSVATHSVMNPPTPGPNLATKGKRGTGPSYGIRWKKKNSEETGTNFRLSNILLRGNADMDPSRRPKCKLCSKPYSCDLMYICCENCKNWFHADAIQLKESKIFDVVGFRCCKCRRKSSPVCPYKDSEGRKPSMRASKQGNMGMDPLFETICKQPDGWETTTALHTKMEKVIIEEDDPLLFSLERVVQIIEPTSEVGPGLDTAGALYHGPQKLPVRRHVKHENDADSFSMNLSHAESTPLEANNLLNKTEEASHPQVKWEFPIDGFKDDEMFDYEGVNYDDREYEPQTYFSYTELLATDDDQLDLFDVSKDTSGNWGNSFGSAAIQPHNLHQDLAIVEPAINTVPCRICSQKEPAPDMSCEICGIWIHKHCSPWDAPSSWEERWRCGHCRDWQ